MSVEVIRSNGPNKPVWIDGHISEGQPGPYDLVFAYPTPLNLVGEMPVNRRWENDNWSHGLVLANLADNRVVNGAMKQIAEYVNSGSYSPDNPVHRLYYQREIIKIYDKLTTDVIEQIQKAQANGEDYVIACPLHGGEFVAAALIHCARGQGFEIPMDRFAHIELKRVFNGKTMVGARIGYMPDCRGKPFIIVGDDCVATDISAKTALALMRNRYRVVATKRGMIDHSTPEAMLVAAAVSQYGFHEFIYQDNVRVAAGTLVHRINEKMYLEIPEDQWNLEHPTHFLVGSMGEWLARLPEEYHTDRSNIAPWNGIRMELVDFWEKREREKGIVMLQAPSSTELPVSQ